MFCKNCGAQIDGNEKFCRACGAKNDGTTREKPTDKKMINEGARVTENIYLCGDGKYRWVYEMPILKNPTIFILVWKIFFFILLGIFAVTLIFDAFEGNLDGEQFLNTLKFMGIFLAGMTVLVALGVLIYAAIMGGKYVVMFEMDNDGINHKQLPKQVKKAEMIGFITALAGLATGNITTVGVGLTSSARSEKYSEFERVRSVKAYPRRHLIKVNERFGKNQVYAESADYDFVLNYIRKRINIK